MTLLSKGALIGPRGREEAKGRGFFWKERGREGREDGAKVHFQAHAHLTLKETRVSRWVGKRKLLPRVLPTGQGEGRPGTRRGKAVT